MNAYGVIISLAIFIVWWVSLRRAIEYGIDKKVIYDLFWVILPSALVGGRLYHIASEWPYYRLHLDQIIQVWHGGMGYYGALGGALLAGGVYCLKHHLPAFKLLDIAAPAIALGQALGRWGNIASYEIIGRPTTLPWAWYVPYEFRPLEWIQYSHFHPVVLYESFAMLFCAGLLLWLSKRLIDKPGSLFLIYLLVYSLVRFLVEFLRVDDTLIWGFPINQVLSVGVFLLAGIGLYIIQRNTRIPTS